MKINGKQELLASIAQRGLVLGALVAMVLSFAAITRAQSGGPSRTALAEKPGAANLDSTQAPNVVAKPSVAPANVPAGEEEKPSAKGGQEGIRVHGHWTIEVRNPDGTVDKHVEFENQICPDQTYTRPGTLQTFPVTATFDGGANFFAGLASGQASAGGWAIILASAAEANTAPVPPGCLSPLDVFTQFDHVSQPSDVLNILQSNAPSGLATNCQNAGTFPTPENCSTTLTPPPAGPSISLNGFIQVPQNNSGTIALVSTANFWCNDGGATSPTACVTTGSALGTLSVPAIVTGTQIPGSGVSYLGGQTIAVSVLISFQ